MKRPKHLGRVSNEPTRKLDVIPWRKGLGIPPHVVLRCSEFTSLCPVTGQPDYAELEVSYIPTVRLVETKSWKLYLWSYRQERAFNEELCARIADDFAAQVKPVEVVVTMRFHARGGIAVQARAVR